MSRDDGKITTEDTRFAQKWFENKGVKLVCPMCQRNEWSSLGHFVTPIQMRGHGAAIFDGTSYPLFGIGCVNCGHVCFFSALAMGFYDDQDDDDQDDHTSETEK